MRCCHNYFRVLFNLFCTIEADAMPIKVVALGVVIRKCDYIDFHFHFP